MNCKANNSADNILVEIQTECHVDLLCNARTSVSRVAPGIQEQ
jgi:hypothetical protein